MYKVTKIQTQAGFAHVQSSLAVGSSRLLGGGGGGGGKGSMLKYEYYLVGGAHHDYATRMIDHVLLWQPKWALLWDYEHCFSCLYEVYACQFVSSACQGVTMV